MICQQGDTNYYSERYNNGNLKFEGCLCDSIKLHGKAFRYTKTGNLEYVYYYNQGMYVYSEKFYTRGRRKGTMKEKSSQRIFRTNPVNECTKTISSEYIDWESAFNHIDSFGRKQGLWKEGIVEDIFIYEMGHYISVGTYFWGVKYGTWYYYNYNTGCLYASCDFNEGLRDGYFTFYYPNGNKSVSFGMRNGVRTGETIYYNPDGTIRRKVKY